MFFVFLNLDHRPAHCVTIAIARAIFPENTTKKMGVLTSRASVALLILLAATSLVVVVDGFEVSPLKTKVNNEIGRAHV